VVVVTIKEFRKTRKWNEHLGEDFELGFDCAGFVYGTGQNLYIYADDDTGFFWLVLGNSEYSSELGRGLHGLEEMLLEYAEGEGLA
jgi:hypothetical protein